ncbi:N-formylglutamate amidohydrolase [Aliiroseovarius sp. 2305UL8-7]|uniref:N-formylglutamate amidohydrolase n=1 Tax=Aliiroseovarius conchicola TaxID=3121637 RepID=UPI003526EA60
MRAPNWPAAALYHASGRAPMVIICEHASSFIPPEYDGLGLDKAGHTSHAAWDIGALDVAKCLSTLLDAPLVAGQVSRLVYDCNRPLEASDCIPKRSEVIDIPGNANLTDTERKRRFDTVHTPFHDSVDWLIDRQTERSLSPVRLVTIHSFTPIFHGQQRAVEIGYLHDSSTKLAEAALEAEAGLGSFNTAINEPYAARDGVTYSLAKHGTARDIDNVMIEVRNDLIDTPTKAQNMAQHLAGVLRSAVSLDSSSNREAI